MTLIGLDLTDAGEVLSSDIDDVGRNALRLRKLVQSYQLSFTVMEKCRVPVIAAVHGACVGGGECCIRVYYGYLHTLPITIYGKSFEGKNFHV